MSNEINISKPSIICSRCDGQGWIPQVGAKCCNNYNEGRCCGGFNPELVQVECNCDRGFVPQNEPEENINEVWKHY
jgi:hypothetical protein